MLNKLTTISFVNQSCLLESPCVLAKCFFVRFNGFNNFIKCYSFVRGDVQQNFNAVVICYPLQMSLHLPRGFCFSHIHSIKPYPYILKFIRMMLLSLIHTICTKSPDFSATKLLNL